jgi:hypothetical protein
MNAASRENWNDPGTGVMRHADEGSVSRSQLQGICLFPIRGLELVHPI